MTETPTDLLVARLERWLVQQPEWPAVFAADRRTRRVACQLLAQRLYHLPSRVQSGVVIDRSIRRELVRQARKKRAFREKPEGAEDFVIVGDVAVRKEET